MGTYAHKLFAVVVEFALKCGLAKNPEMKEAGTLVSHPDQAGQAGVERTAQEAAAKKKMSEKLYLCCNSFCRSWMCVSFER